MIKEILFSIGYKLTDDGNFWRTKPLYRNSDNPTSLRIAKNNGRFIDFSAGKSGSFEELVKLSLNLTNIDEAKSWLGAKNFLKPEPDVNVKINSQPIWNKNIISTLEKNHSYWKAKGISQETCEIFQGGILNNWKMDNRYVFPIFDKAERIIGFSGRDLTNRSLIKWKHLGKKQLWVWPSHLNRSIIKESGEVILVESPGCVLKLWENGIKNSICLFGTMLNDSIICFLAGVNPNKVIIATNNEPENNNIGNNAAIVIKNRLSRFINENKLAICLPSSKDFGEMSNLEISKWKASLP